MSPTAQLLESSHYKVLELSCPGSMHRMLIPALCFALTSCSDSQVVDSTDTDDSKEPLVRIFARSDRKTTDAYFWDRLRDDVPAWKDLKYEWIASSTFGDQIILTHNSPIHDGSAVYMLGPDISGPDSTNPYWPDNLIYLGPSVDEWSARMERFGDEFSVAPGSIDDMVDDADEYRRIYRELNPGLAW